MKKIGILDYGMGNLFSLKNALKKLNAEVVVTKPADLEDIDSLILPGVGAFGAAMEKLLRAKGPITRFADSGKPLLGICLGMQLFFESSEESPRVRGLGLFEGKVVRFKRARKVPQVGWNSVNFEKESDLFEGIPNRSFFYFVHSYYPDADDGLGLGSTIYGEKFYSVVGKGNVFGVQFHPEKSGRVGLKMLKNFAELV